MHKRGFAHVRVGLAGARHGLHKRDSCATGGFYTNPTTGMTVSSANPVNISWDTSCLPNTSAVDIYLIAPGLPNPRIHEWQNVNFALGSYQTTLEPRWWNDSSSASLQLSIVTSGSQPFLSTLPAGPVFTATYTAPTSGSTPADADLNSPSYTVTNVNNFPTNSSLSKGKIAAGILVPLFFIAIGIYVYIKIKRSKGKEERRRFSEAVDKRMSTISSDWKSITPAGATAAIRNSIAVGSIGNRSSAFTFGAIRPVSTMAVEGDSPSAEKQSFDIAQMSQLRPGIRASAFGERVSRVSFATDVRPSLDSRRTTTTSRAFRSSRTSSFIPPLPIPPSPIRNDTGDMSPTQTKGPLSLSAEDIKACMEDRDAAESLSNVDEVWPSLSMMRTGDEQAVGDEYLLPQKQSIDLPMPPFPIHPAPASPPSGMMTIPDNMMSPDEMLRAYATRKITSPPTSPIAFPTRTLSYNGSSMRNLYTPTTPTPTSTPESPRGVAARVSVIQTTDAEKRYTSSYASMDPYAGFTG